MSFWINHFKLFILNIWKEELKMNQTLLPNKKIKRKKLKQRLQVYQERDNTKPGTFGLEENII